MDRERWRTIRHGALLCVLIVGLPVRERAVVVLRQERVAALPTVISAGWPTIPPIARAARMNGEVVLRVTTDGSSVLNVQIVKSAGMLDQAAEANVRTWQFEPHPVTTFEVKHSFALHDEAWGCGRGLDEVNARFPSEIGIKAGINPICDQTWPIGGYRAVKALVRCDCPGKPALSGAQVRVLNSRGLK